METFGSNCNVRLIKIRYFATAWEPENYGTESVFDVVTSKIISNLLNHLFSYMDLLQS